MPVSQKPGNVGRVFRLLRLPVADLAALRITLLYLAFGVLWIFASDWLRGLLYSGRETESNWQLQKSLMFLSISALILHIGVRQLLTALQAQRRSEALLAEAEALTLFMVGQLTPEGAWLNAPHRLAKLLNIELSELVSQPIWTYVKRTTRDVLRAHVDAAVAGKQQAFEVELQLQAKGGAAIWLGANFSLVKSSRAQVPHFVVYLRNITPRRHAEESLRRSERLLRQIMDLVPQFIFAKDDQGRFVLANKAVANAYGTRVEELLYKTDADFSHTEAEIQHFQKWDQAVLETRQPVYIPEELITDRTGEVRILETTKIPFLLPDTQTPAVLGVSTDITERARAQAALRESQNRFRSLIEHALDPLLIFEIDGRFVDVNRQACDALNYSRHDLLELSFADILADPDPVLRILESLEDQTPVTIETIQRRADGTTFPVEMRVGILEESGKRLVLALARDVTRRQRAEKERSVFSKLAINLAAVETLGKAAEQVREAIDELWNWDAVFISARRSGRGRFTIILEIDTVDGQKRSFPASNYDGVEHRGLEELQSGKPILINRGTNPQHYPLRPFGANEQVSQSMMYAPILVGQQLIGLLSVQSYTPSAFAPRDLTLLQRLAELVGPCLERCRAEARSKAFAQLGERLSAARTPEEAARTVVQTADELLGWDACMFDLYSAGDDHSYSVLAYDIVNGVRQQVDPPQRSIQPMGLSRRAIEEGPLLVLRDATFEPGEDLRPFGDMSRPSLSIMWVPVTAGGSIIGLLSFQSYTPQAYDREDLQLVQSLANHCSGALERTRVEQALRNSDERYRRAISETGAVPYERRYGDNTFVFVGEGIDRITGYSAAELTTELWQSMVREVIMQGESAGIHFDEATQRTRAGMQKEWLADIRIENRSGEIRWVSDSSIQLLDDMGIPYGSLGILQDITDRKRAEAELLHNAFHDAVTGLPNRALLMDRLNHALARCRRKPEYRFAILFLDLDRFKNINDSLGHIVGDEVLRITADRLMACLRPGDTVARFAGDEFTMLLDDVQTDQEVSQISDRVLSELNHPMTINGREVFTSASIGIAFGSPNYAQPDEMLRDADNALYRAKALGKARYEIFTESMHAQAIQHMEMENDLRRAIARRELTLHYQPILSLATGQIISFEALARWPHPTRGLVPASAFIALAEETGLIRALGSQVLRDACMQLRKWQDITGTPSALSISVNLSARQFSEPQLVSRILAILAEAAVSPRNIRLEITETVLLENPEETAKQLHLLKDAGFEIYLDDFGTGFSSLSYLHQLPIDGVKIDQSFISRLQHGSKECEIVRSIILMAASLGIDVTAEGVCTMEQFTMLRELNCQAVQGFLFSMAVPAEEAEDLLLNGVNSAVFS